MLIKTLKQAVEVTSVVMRNSSVTQSSDTLPSVTVFYKLSIRKAAKNFLTSSMITKTTTIISDLKMSLMSLGID